MRIYRAAWVLPIAAPPVRHGWVAIQDARIFSVGGPENRPPAGDIETWTESSAIMPALVNAHTHLELSWARGRIPPASSMPEWASQMISLRRGSTPGSESIVRAIAELKACGTALVGDVTNTLEVYGPLLDSDLSACVFYELLGFNTADAERQADAARARLEELAAVERLRCSVVPHAPYSVAPELFEAIARRSHDRVLSVHLAESIEEMEFLETGTGAWRRVLEEVGAWNPAWTPTGLRPVEYLDRMGLVNGRLLAVHGCQLSDAELQRLAAAGATVVTCPRSNQWTGAGPPPLSRFYASGARIAVGTDSLGSVEDLNVFQELMTIRTLAPGVPPARLLESATRSGADALGFGTELGTIEPGKRAALIAVRIPADVPDVEEYLVSGIDPDDVTWLSA